jgi:hypothetical protein
VHEHVHAVITACVALVCSPARVICSAMKKVEPDPQRVITTWDMHQLACSWKLHKTPGTRALHTTNVVTLDTHHRLLPVSFSAAWVAYCWL